MRFDRVVQDASHDCESRRLHVPRDADGVQVGLSLAAFSRLFSLLERRYLGNEARELEKEGFNAIFAYEEAIGYMHGKEIRDKDGVRCSL